jgi:hypothetical protein
MSVAMDHLLYDPNALMRLNLNSSMHAITMNLQSSMGYQSSSPAFGMGLQPMYLSVNMVPVHTISMPAIMSTQPNMTLAEQAKTNAFAKQLYDLHMQGNMAMLQKLHATIAAQQSKWDKIFKNTEYTNRANQLRNIEAVLHHPVTQLLHDIKHDDVSTAQQKFENFKNQLLEQDRKILSPSPGTLVQTTLPPGTQAQVFQSALNSREFQEAERILKSRPDYQQTTQQQTTYKIQILDHVPRLVSTPVDSILPPTGSLQPLKDQPEFQQIVPQLQSYRDTISKQLVTTHIADACLQKQVLFIDALLDGTIADVLSTISYADPDGAVTLLYQLADVWPWDHNRDGFLARSSNPQEEVFIKLIGFDVMYGAQASIVSRRDVLLKAGILSQVESYGQQCKLWQMQGDLTCLNAELARVQTAIRAGVHEISPLLTQVECLMLTQLRKDALTNHLCTIVHGDLVLAQKALGALQMDLLEFFERSNVSTWAQARARVVEEKGFDVFRAGHACFQARADCPANSAQQYAFDEQLLTMLANIRNADASTAQQEFEALQAQVLSYFGSQQINDVAQARACMLEQHGFDAIEVATLFYEARPDCLHPSSNSSSTSATSPIINGAQTTASSYTVNSSSDRASSTSTTSVISFKSVQESVIESLNTCHTPSALANALGNLSDAVFTQALSCNYDVHSDLQEQVNVSIARIKLTNDAHTVICNVCIVERVLTDIQMQTQPQLAQQQPLLERTPALLARGLYTFVMRCNPIAQTVATVEFWVNTIHFGCDVTLGKLYLSPEDYKARISNFSSMWKGLSPSVLAQLSAEQWMDISATFLADFAYGRCDVSKTLNYLKEVQALGKNFQEAMVVADKLKSAVDVAIAKNPIVIAKNGMLHRMNNLTDEMKGAAKEIIKDSRALLESAYAKMIFELEQEIEALRPLFDCTRKGFGSFANKNIKINYKHILGMDIKFYPNKIDFGGFHHDLMGAIEQSGVVQFVNKVVHKTGAYKADIIVNGKSIRDKTFFPASWSRKQVIAGICEAYDNFKKSGASEIVFRGGKYTVIGITNQGMEILMHITENGLIASAYPILKS